MMLKTQKTGFTNQLDLEFTLKKPSFPRDVISFYPKICPLTSKIRGKMGLFVALLLHICICGSKGIKDYRVILQDRNKGDLFCFPFRLVTETLYELNFDSQGYKSVFFSGCYSSFLSCSFLCSHRRKLFHKFCILCNHLYHR